MIIDGERLIVEKERVVEDKMMSWPKLAKKYGMQPNYINNIKARGKVGVDTLGKLVRMGFKKDNIKPLQSTEKSLAIPE